MGHVAPLYLISGRNQGLPGNSTVRAADNALLQIFEKLLDCQADILDNLPQQERRDIATGVKRNGRVAAIRMSELFVRTALTYFHEAQML